MKKLYIVFDQIPSKESGGLVTTYLNLVKILKQDYEIHILSIFDANIENKQLFKDYPVHTVNKNMIDIRFFKAFKYLFNEKNLKKFLYGVKSFFLYFLSIPFMKKNIAKMIYAEDRVIVSSPSAAIFMPKQIKFILEIHTKYEYFFGNNVIGKLQSSIMTKPYLMLFRSKVDANKAKKKFNADYMYNTVNLDKVLDEKDYYKINNRFLFVGRLSVEKNLLKLLEVASILKGKSKKFIIDIYGSGPMEKILKDEVRRLSIDDCVFFKGFTNNKYVYFNYAAFLLTSSIEGFPLTIIEAKANSTPTITTKWGEAVYETVKDDYDGYIINDNDANKIADKLIFLMNNQEELKRLSKNASNEFDKFSREEARKKWIKILK